MATTTAKKHKWTENLFNPTSRLPKAKPVDIDKLREVLAKIRKKGHTYIYWDERDADA